MSPFTALSMLHCHLTRKQRLTEGEFDHAFDAITMFLEDCNNTKYRLQPSITDDTPKGEKE